MDRANHFSLLEMIEHPAFYVQDGMIVRANRAAQHKLFQEGESVMDFLPQDGNAYAVFNGGCMYLSVQSHDISYGASVTRIDDFDLFLLDTEGEKLEAFALASKHLKVPLCNIASALEELFVGEQKHDLQYDSLRKSIHQLSRIISNMSDANWMRTDSSAQLEPTEFSGFFQELMEKMSALTEAAGCVLKFQNLTEPVIGLADRELLLRAVSNILSNAIKFSPKGSLIQASVVQKGTFLHLAIADPGEEQHARCDVFTRYLRPAVIEDSRYGIGLGMRIVHSVAIDHGGTVLVDTPKGGGTRVTMTIAIRQSDELVMRSPIRLPGGNYTAGLDAGLVEFSEVLPAAAYKDIQTDK